ncbi:MAG: ATP-dependent DNA helicase RecG [Crocinitomicaceae bacterium]|nr:ATP-dependent DNA helicase RecG [Crocinitomicaceae bacterium]
MNEFLQTPIAFLKGVGPQRADLLRQEINVVTVNDLLNYFPFRYVDRSAYHTVADLRYLDSYAQLRGTIIAVNEVAIGRQKKLVAKFQDTSGLIELVWFQGIHFIKPMLKLGAEYQVYGKAKMYGNNWNIPHPELTEWQNVGQKTGIQPVYSSTEKLASKGLHTKGIEKLTAALALQLKGKIPEILPAEILKAHNFMSREAAFKEVHLPTSEHAFHVARQRLKFEELFFLQMELLLRKQISVSKSKGFIFSEVGSLFSDFYEHYLPFSLTGAQKRVLKEIRKDFLSGHHMNRLLQGDVGSGKTLVALLTMLIANGNGFQAALMAPTEILANQHAETLREMVKDLPIRIELMTGSVKKKNRVHIHEGLEDGSVHILVGTHALLEDTVQFANLGCVVIDEQHRFGVAQRARMWRKNTTPPHILIMTATPIPRTLAMTFYGDLDVSVIDELPPGRKPISTVHRYESHRLRVFGFMKEEIEKGRQIYIVYPLINESEKLDFNNLMSGYEAISRSFPLPNYRISIVHGQMKPEDKEFEMQRFIKGETQIMVATTVIEVGVNVPNASVMIIESSERFGLSQLHQLRGRVGRGAEQSYCILMTGDKLSKDTLKRVETMVRSSDGFEIAEVDLQLRGPGDLMGTQQSGLLNLKIADLAKDSQLVILARDAARSILEKDPNLSLPEYASIRMILVDVLKTKPDWGKIA